MSGIDLFGWLEPNEKARKPLELSASEREALMPEVRRLLLNGRPIEAVKFVREQHRSMGLREAKEFVDTILNEMRFGPSSIASGKNDVEDGSFVENLRRLLARGRKIEAIALVREHRVMGLKEAKDYVDALERETKLGQ